jgi:TolB protein
MLKRPLLVVMLAGLVLAIATQAASAGAPILIGAADGASQNPIFDSSHEAWSMRRDGTHVAYLSEGLPVPNAAWDATRRGFFYTTFVKPPYEIHHVVRGVESRVTHNRISEFLIDAGSNGSRLVTAAERATYADIYTISLETGALRRLTFSPANDWDPDWSPDARQLVWVRGDELWIMGGRGQNKHPVGDGIEGMAPAWSPSGRSILYVRPTGDIMRVRPDGTHLRIVVENDDVWGTGLVRPLWSPDGGLVAFTARRYSEVEEAAHFRIYVFRFDTGRIRNITPDLSAQGWGTDFTALDW